MTRNDIIRMAREAGIDALIKVGADEIERFAILLAAADQQTDVARDAARYRWLRDQSVPPHNFYISVPDEFHGVRYQPSEVDAYIDAAIAAAPKGGL